MAVRSVIISLSLGCAAASLLMIFHSPDTAELNLGGAMKIVRVLTYISVLAGPVLVAACATRLKIVGWVGICLIIAAAGITYALTETSGGTVGSPGWVSGFVSILIVIPFGLLLCAIAGVASLMDILEKAPAAMRPVIISFCIPAVLTTAYYIAAGRTPNVDRLLEDLKRPAQYYEYTSIGVKLSEIEAPQMVDPLIALLKDDNPHIRIAAAMALGGRSRHVRAIRPLLEALAAEGDASVKVWIIRAIGHTTPRAGVLKQSMVADALIAELKTGDQEPRKAAATNLGFIKAEKAVPPLIDAMRDEGLRFSVENALIEITGQRLGDDPDVWLKYWRERQRNHP